MSDQFATGVHFMIFYLSFASSPNKLHHKYFRMSGLAPYSLQYIIFLNSKSKKDLHSKSKTLPNFKGYE